jgi:OmpA-OmpF porin, OOP family
MRQERADRFPMKTVMKTLLAATLCVASAASAQNAVPGFDLERLTLNPAPRASLWASTGDTYDAGEFRIGLAGHYQSNPLVFNLLSSGTGGNTVTRKATIVGNRVTAHLTGAYAIVDWLEVGLQVPLVVFQNGDSNLATTIGVANPESFALGTPFIQARLAPWKESKGDVLDLALHLGVGLPVGSLKALTTDNQVNFEPRLGLGKRLGFIRIGAEVGAQLRQGVQGLTLSSNPSTVRDEVGSRLGAGLVLSTTGDGVRGELGGRIDVPFSKTGMGGELLAGIRLPFADQFELFALGGPGFGSYPGIPTFRILAGLSYGGVGDGKCYNAPSTREGCDYDRDGVKNEVDLCATEPGTAELKGCPFRDTDKDGISDDKDACPNEVGTAERRGCPLRDTDKDGIPDDADACPTQPGTAQLKGCPARDSDKDGVPDDADACPNEAGLPDKKGCPARDSDKDGITDDLDACPNEPGVKEKNGCPIRDEDKDGVPDDVDNCPKEPGTKENQGCKKKQLVVITKEKLIIKEQVFFATAKSTILPKSFTLLNQVADILKSHPEVTKMRIEGHTDNKGKRDYNLNLSQSRADSVKSYLVKRGVAADRLEGRGFGPDKPIDTNDTEAGRALNRRVEFGLETAETVKEKSVE